MSCFQGGSMSGLKILSSAAAVLLAAASIATAQPSGATLAVTMTNDPSANEIKVYDAGTGTLLQTLSTFGKGGVSNNARGLRQYNGQLLAVVNNGSNSVALFRRDGDSFRFDKLVTTTSA